MLLSAVSVLVVAQSSSEIPKGLMNNPVYTCVGTCVCSVCVWRTGANSWTVATYIFFRFESSRKLFVARL